jgi:type I restriction-modification system DNA methylase subunit
MKKIQNKLALIPEKEAKEIISNQYIDYVKDKNTAEKNVDSKVQSILIDKLKYDETEAVLAITKLKNSDIVIPSKTVKASGTGEIDCAVFINNELKIIIEDKKPNESVKTALDEAIFYADGLNAKGEDIRVAIGFNGIEFILRVLDHTSNKWVPFFVNGSELKAFPGKLLLDIIYYQKDVHGIAVEEVNEEINIKDIINNLKTIYRNIELQNDNQKTIDFTIAFIGLKSILEKYRGQGIRQLKNWEDLNPKENPTDNDSGDDEELRDNITSAIDKISEKIGREYDDLFIIKDSEDIEQFNFKKTLNTFKNDYELKSLRKIYIQISRLHDLHDSKIDLFGEVYESLGDKNTKKAFGQYFTRRHIIKSLIELMEIDVNDFIGTVEEKLKRGNVYKVASNPKKICDPACGTGGFLTEFFKHVLDKVKSNNTYSDINISDLAEKSFYGYDIYTSNVSRTKINMYLAGDGFSEIRKADTLQDTEIESNKFDYIITNPPYGKGTYTVNYPFCDENGNLVFNSVINSQRLEVNFLVKIVDMLKPNGRAMAIIPDGVLEATTLSPLREWFLKYCKLEKVVSLPKHAFAPYTHEKTYAIFFQKRSEPLAKIEDTQYDSAVWCYIVDNDGFVNSDKRFRTDRMNENGKYLHDEFSQWRGIDGSINDSLIVERYKRKTQLPDEKFYNEWDDEVRGLKYGYITMNQLLEDEFVSYPSVSSSDILKMINENIENKYDLEKIATSSELTEEESELKNYLCSELLKKDIRCALDGNTFYDLKKPITFKSRDLANFINDSLSDELKIKGSKDLLTENNELKPEYKSLLDELEIKYDLSKTTPKFFVPETFKEIEWDKLKKIVLDILKLSDIREIFNDDEIKEEYQELLEEKNIEYDLYENKFFNMGKKIITKTLVLTPEKYFRQEEVKAISIDEMKQSNKELLSDIKDLLSGFGEV